MTSRVLITVRCYRRGCKLARVLAGEDGRVIEVSMSAAVRTASGIGRSGGPIGTVTEPFERGMAYTATCDCGGGYLVNCAELDRAIASGTPKIVLRPTM